MIDLSSWMYQKVMAELKSSEISTKRCCKVNRRRYRILYIHSWQSSSVSVRVYVSRVFHLTKTKENTSRATVSLDTTYTNSLAVYEAKYHAVCAVGTRQSSVLKLVKSLNTFYAEMAVMRSMFDQASEHESETRRLHEEHVPPRMIPERGTFSSIDKRFQVFGTFDSWENDRRSFKTVRMGETMFTTLMSISVAHNTEKNPIESHSDEYSIFVSEPCILLFPWYNLDLKSQNEKVIAAFLLHAATSPNY